MENETVKPVFRVPSIMCTTSLSNPLIDYEKNNWSIMEMLLMWSIRPGEENKIQHNA